MSFLKSFLKREEVRVRFAPSPTGSFHIGSARTTLFNFLFAKKCGGKFILRIEDTDLERSNPEYEKDILEGLKWLGIYWDEGIEIGGPFAPYRQSERLELYADYIKKLLSNGDAFYCFHSKEFLDREYEEQVQDKKNPAHFCEFRKLPSADAQKRLVKAIPDGRQENAIVRFKTPADIEIAFDDLIRGEIRFNTNTLGGDFSLAKAIGPNEFLPLYNFAVVIDDYLMNISYVIRGEDHISNTPKQILIQQALAIPRPKYAHLPLILGPDKSKLSKRHGAVSVNDYRQMGYLPQALVNFIALLGWNPGTNQEIFSLKELIKEFNLDKVGKSGAVFNIEKLDWLNGHYIRQLSLDELTEYIVPFLIKYKLIEKDNYNPEYIKKILALEQPRLKKLDEIGGSAAYFFRIPKYNPNLLIWRDMMFKDVIISLKISRDALMEINDENFTLKNLENILLQEAARAKNKDRGRLLWPLRVTLTGLETSPSPFEILEILGKKESLKRIDVALENLA